METLPRQVCGWGRDVLQWLASELLRAAERERADALHCFGAWSRRGPCPRAHAAPWLLRLAWHHAPALLLHAQKV